MSACEALAAAGGRAVTADMLVLAVLGHPAPQGSKRHVGKGIMVESSKKLAPWREAVRSAAAEARSFDPLDEPVEVTMTFTFARPRSHYRSGRNWALLRDTAPSAPIGPPDLSKLIRSTEDALVDAGVLKDDARVVTHQARKVWAREHPEALDAPGVVVRVRRLGGAAASTRVPIG